MRELQALGKISGKEISLRRNQEDFNLVNLYYTDCKYSGGSKNYFEMFILTNGALFISEPLFESLI